MRHKNLKHLKKKKKRKKKKQYKIQRNTWLKSRQRTCFTKNSKKEIDKGGFHLYPAWPRHAKFRKAILLPQLEIVWSSSLIVNSLFAP